MRTIKFRAWDKKTKTMYADIPLITLSSHVKEKDETLNKSLKSIQSDSIDFELIQFTGLLDKNGKEIYEGDIVDSDGDISVVEYGIQEVDAFEGMGWNLWSFFDDDGNGYKANGMKLQRELEVIGNIFENPELIKN